MQFCVKGGVKLTWTANGHYNKPPISDIPFPLKCFFFFEDMCMSLTYINKQIFNKLPDFIRLCFVMQFRLTHLWLIFQ